jgi:predicted PurR-regulated permease PerM
MNLKPTPARLLAAITAASALWIVHGFVQALLAAGVIAIASWPMYRTFESRLPACWRRSGGAAAIFTVAITVFLLAPMVFACWALLSEARVLLQGLAAADSTGLVPPAWLADLPGVGASLAARWQQQLAQPGSLLMLSQHTDPRALLGWAQSLGQSTFRHGLLVAFTILLLGPLYQHGASLARELTDALRQAVGDAAERYVAVGTRAVRASVNSMLVVGLYDGLATAAAYACAGAPRPLLWAAITGALAAVPFLGYAVVAAMAVQLALQGLPAAALLAPMLGAAVLLSGDKLVRPMVARGGVQLPFVWVLMGCIGGFGVLGLAGVVIGPVVLSLASEAWKQRVRGIGDDALHLPVAVLPFAVGSLSKDRDAGPA